MINFMRYSQALDFSVGKHCKFFAHIQYSTVPMQLGFQEGGVLYVRSVNTVVKSFRLLNNGKALLRKKLIIVFKGTVSRDFRLLVFFTNQFPPSS